MKNTKETIVSKLPKCDFCECNARYNAKTKNGPWAYMCLRHWKNYALSDELGLGIGQNLITENEL